jgi:glycerophosphoryl diester phosphodiesterase
MIILSHRGYWKQIEERNSPEAFHRSFSLGFGTELDVRDYGGRLVVSHDPADSSSLDFESFLKIYCYYDKELYIAINVKADGLQPLLLGMLRVFDINNYFVFDMSIPDALGYLKCRMKTFTRESEFEINPAYYEQAEGIWMDEFNGHWITSERINYHLNNGKKVCIVSPELHGRPHLPAWKDYRLPVDASWVDDLMLCTDFPEEARRYFYDQCDYF